MQGLVAGAGRSLLLRVYVAQHQSTTPCGPGPARLFPRAHSPTALLNTCRSRINRYIGFGGFFVGVYLIYHAKPLEAMDIKYWAAPRAAKELEVEMRMLDKLNAQPELKERLVTVAKGLNMIEDEAYDLVCILPCCHEDAGVQYRGTLHARHV